LVDSGFNRQRTFSRSSSSKVALNKITFDRNNSEWKCNYL